MEVQFGKMKYAGDERGAVSLGCTLKKIKIGILYYVCFISFFFFKRNNEICMLRKGRTYFFKGKQNNTCKQPERVGRSYQSTGLRPQPQLLMLGNEQGQLSVPLHLEGYSCNTRKIS